MKAIAQAFDAAWESIAVHFGDDPKVIEEARFRPANCVLSVATDESRNVEVLTRGALEALARSYRSKIALDAPLTR